MEGAVLRLALGRQLHTIIYNRDIILNSDIEICNMQVQWQGKSCIVHPPERQQIDMQYVSAMACCNVLASYMQ